jgi:hypothetical protein
MDHECVLHKKENHIFARRGLTEGKKQFNAVSSRLNVNRNHCVDDRQRIPATTDRNQFRGKLCRIAGRAAQLDLPHHNSVTAGSGRHLLTKAALVRRPSTMSSTSSAA